ncbi:hypothetical protein BGW80DRAFT_132291 [Lactifluus volemus]|nr:hypothetical protein BGW80DRAFT_132291 [Lactifluus volemus]
MCPQSLVTSLKRSMMTYTTMLLSLLCCTSLFSFIITSAFPFFPLLLLTMSSRRPPIIIDLDGSLPFFFFLFPYPAAGRVHASVPIWYLNFFFRSGFDKDCMIRFCYYL